MTRGLDYFAGKIAAAGGQTGERAGLAASRQPTLAFPPHSGYRLRARWETTSPLKAFFDTGQDAMAKGKKKLEVVHLVCEETGELNYTLRRKTGGEKLKLKKYSPTLRKHTLHNEKRK